jgi:hypothetical protein
MPLVAGSGCDVRYPVDLGERAQTNAHWCVAGCEVAVPRQMFHGILSLIARLRTSPAPA